MERLPVLWSVSAKCCQVHFWHSQDSCWCSQGLSQLYSILILMVQTFIYRHLEPVIRGWRYGPADRQTCYTPASRIMAFTPQCSPATTHYF